ncbi:scamp family-domain-containing protein [Mycotypha africana]|uniref:scamp family-domain-containing protein n=1 Tax=Mycotypha africana TaxID=64632 RepID=UPI002301E99D|nr:scamp family-domain-containing protein [Mycotypha africana]KAI8979240.1 scamp family-domain-containing protein [Mycotypha africana]
MSKPNPFDDPSNPFEDPSITHALNSSSPIIVEEPSNDKQSEDIFSVPLYSFNDTSSQQAPTNHSPYNGHSSSSTAAFFDTSKDNLSTREEALKRKEQELADKERQLNQQREQLQQQRTRGANNFPPCFPIMYLDIVAEIPDQHQQTVLWFYREWLLFLVTLVLNFFASLWTLFSHPESVSNSAPTNMGVALTELFTHTLASFFLWYRPIYNAYMKDNSLYFTLFFLFNGFHILYTFYMAIGIPSTGGAGLIVLVTLFQEHYIGPAVLTLLATIGWLSMGIMAVILYRKTFVHYKAAGHTLKEAKTEAYTHMGRSSVVREAAMNAAWKTATSSSGNRT